MAKAFHIAIVFLSALLAAASFAGCAEDETRETCPALETPEPAGAVFLRFRVNLNSFGTRAETETPGTSFEDAAKRIDLLVYDAMSDELIDFIRLDEQQTSEITSAAGLVVPVYASKSGKVRIFVSVNTPDALDGQFNIGHRGRDFIITSRRTDYWDVMNDFVPGCAGKQELLTDRQGGIPMTGKFVAEGTENDVIDIAHVDAAASLTFVAHMEHIVAKVHVLAQSAEYDTSKGKVFYVNAKGQKAAMSELADAEYSDWIGWIRLSDVRYMPNGMNKSSYLFRQENLRPSQLSPYMDPNMDLSFYLVGGILDAPLYARDYVFYDGLSMHRLNIAPEDYLAHAEAYDENRISATEAGTDDRYVRGMYCPENYFDAPESPDPFADFDYPLPMVTHISIAAQLTPRNIVLLTNYKNSIDQFVQKSRIEAERFEREYGFTQEEADRWENVIKPRYFEEKTAGGVTKDKEYPLYRGLYNIISTLSEADANDILSWSLKGRRIWSSDPSDFENDKWPDGTFYVYDTNWDPEGSVSDEDKALWPQRYLYFAAGAVYGENDSTENSTSTRIKTYSVPHLGGWCYYYTYIDPEPDAAAAAAGAAATSYEKSQVARNHYYIVTVDNFGSPGGTITRPEYIKTNTEPVDWNYVGQGNINLH